MCNPRRNALLKEGSKSDRIDARKLAELLRSNMLRSVYHGENGVRTLKELARSYLTISKDLGRVMSRVKAIYRSWGVPCTGKQVYAPRYRSEWLGKIREAGVRRRAEFYYQQLDALRPLRQEVRRELLAEARKHDARKWLRSIPFLGPIRAALVIALIQTPAPVPYQATALDLQWVWDRDLQQCRSSFGPGGAEALEEAGLDSRAESKSQSRSEELYLRVPPPWPLPSRDRSKSFTIALVAKGIRPEMARLTLARKIAAITLIVWKKGERFDAKHLKPQTA